MVTAAGANDVVLARALAPSLVAIVISSALAFAGEAPDEQAAARPGVVLLMCDDLGWGDVGFNGSRIVRTPHLDAMARASLRFTRFYAAAPVCSPTRGSALTGRHPYRYGITFANRGHLLDDEVTLAEALRARGYATGHFGKWHLGTLTTRVRDSNRGAPGKTEHYAIPSDHGFDVYFSTEAKVPTYDPMLAPAVLREGESRSYGWVPVGERPDDDRGSRPYGTRYWTGEERAAEDGLEGDDSSVIVDRAVTFIEEAVRAGRPFFAVIWFHTPHLPVVAGKRHRDLYAERPLAEQLYYGSISAMDEQVGRLRKRLRDIGAAENTMVWFASDNGPERGTPGSAGPFRGRKRSLYEGGVRVPALLEWPARIRSPRVTDAPCVTSDYLPTVLDVLGPPPEGAPDTRRRPIDGVSLVPLIDGRDWTRPRPIGFWSGDTLVWSDTRHKLMLRTRREEVEIALHDLLADRSETRNIATEQAEIVARMRGELLEWQRECRASARGEDYPATETETDTDTDTETETETETEIRDQRSEVGIGIGVGIGIRSRISESESDRGRGRGRGRGRPDTDTARQP